MSESEYDSADEYTSLMDGHVAETRTDGLGPPVERKKRLNKVASSVEVRPVTQSWIQFYPYFKHRNLLTYLVVD